MNGTEWYITEISKVVDGDTIHVIRERELQLGDEWFSIADLKPKAIRLTWVDTPERGTPGWSDARQDLRDWIDTAPRLLRVICYESAGWDRILGDLIDADGNSASQWLMTEGNNGAGWPAYERGK